MFKEAEEVSVATAVEPSFESSATYKSDYELERNKPMPNLTHALIQMRLNNLLLNKYDGQFIFPNELSLDSTPSSTPDICVYPKKKADRAKVTAKEKSIPLTAIEIISPSQSVKELVDKARNLYFPLGVKSYWLVIPEFLAIRIFWPDGKQIQFEKGKLTDPATGIQLAVEKVFQDLD